MQIHSYVSPKTMKPVLKLWHTKSDSGSPRFWKPAMKKLLPPIRKYEQINPAEIGPPGHFTQTPSGAINREAAESLITHLENNDGIETSSGKINRITVTELSEMSNAEIAQYLNDFPEAGGWADSTERGLREKLEECVKANPQRFTEDLQPFQGVRNRYQHSILSGLLDAWRDKREFGWSVLLEFIHQILLSEQFWTEHSEEPFNYRNRIISTIADLITEGTRDDKHAFDIQLLPITEKILLILAEKAKPSATFIDLRFSVLDSVMGQRVSGDGELRLTVRPN